MPGVWKESLSTRCVERVAAKRGSEAWNAGKEGLGTPVCVTQKLPTGGELTDVSLVSVLHDLLGVNQTAGVCLELELQDEALAQARLDDTEAKMKASDTFDPLESVEVSEGGISQLELEIKQLQDKKTATDAKMKALQPTGSVDPTDSVCSCI